MKFKLLLIAVFFVFFSCKKKGSPKIIYELDKELTSKIFEEYTKLKEIRELIYISFDLGDHQYRSVKLSFCDECKIKNIIPYTNRFLKVKENILIPVVFSPDFIFESNSKYELRAAVGGSIVFDINIQNKLIRVRHSM